MVPSMSPEVYDYESSTWTPIQQQPDDSGWHMRHEFGYGKNNEVQLLVWWPRDLEEGDEGLETLVINAVLLSLAKLASPLP